MTEDKLKDVMEYFYIYDIIDEFNTKQIKIFYNKFDPIIEIMKIRSDNIKLKKFLMDLSMKGLKIDKKNIDTIMTRIVSI